MQTFHEWFLRRTVPEDILARSIPHEEGTVGAFRQSVLDRLGDLAVLVLDVRLAGGYTRSLVGCPAVGSPDDETVRRIVRQVKELAGSLGDSPVLRRIQRAMEEESFQKLGDLG